MKRLPDQLFKLLSIHSPSRREDAVVDYLVAELAGLLDRMEVDGQGNIYGEVKMGLADYTVLLSAHMDTVASVPPKPYWKGSTRKNNLEIHTRSSSALGGDDKCGLAAHLAVLRNLKNTTFTGTVKVLFSVAEEIGCVGAEAAAKERPEWFEGIKAAIVIDRRGGTDIVTGMSWGGGTFCSKEYGEFWERMSGIAGFKAAVTGGTISDTMVFSERFTINGVNLSAGYYNPHSSQEYIRVREVVRTAKWVLAALDHIQAETFPEFEYHGVENDDWMDSYYHNRYYTPSSSRTAGYFATKGRGRAVDGGIMTHGTSGRDEDYTTWDRHTESFLSVTSCDFCWQEDHAEYMVSTDDLMVLCTQCSPYGGSGERYNYATGEYVGNVKSSEFHAAIK